MTRTSQQAIYNLVHVGDYSKLFEFNLYTLSLQTMVAMAQNWMRSSLLPSKYWYHAIKRVCKICNILHIKKDDTVAMPHKLIYGSKPDYQSLILRLA